VRKEMPFKLSLSEQAVKVLEQLAQHGIYGATPEEVAERFVDRAIQRFVTPPHFKFTDPPPDSDAKK
jgi:hypothetical protein